MNTVRSVPDHSLKMIAMLYRATTTPSLRARRRGVKNYAYVSSGGMYKDSDEVSYLCVSGCRRDELT